MISNCKGCIEELNMAFEYQSQGLHLVQSEITHLGEKGKHLFIIMVDDKGKEIIQ